MHRKNVGIVIVTGIQLSYTPFVIKAIITHKHNNETLHFTMVIKDESELFSLIKPLHYWKENYPEYFI